MLRRIVYLQNYDHFFRLSTFSTIRLYLSRKRNAKMAENNRTLRTLAIIFEPMQMKIVHRFLNCPLLNIVNIK